MKRVARDRATGKQAVEWYITNRGRILAAGVKAVRGQVCTKNLKTGDRAAMSPVDFDQAYEVLEK